MLSNRSILIEGGVRIVKALRKLTPRATGKTQKAIKAKVFKDKNGDYKLNIVVPDQFPFTTEHGRGKGLQPPIDVIEAWVSARGLDVKPFVIAKTIGEKGTRLDRKGGQADKVNKAISKEADWITSKLADLEVKKVLKTIDDGN